MAGNRDDLPKSCSIADAKRYLECGVTCALTDGSTVLTSGLSGIRPMMEWLGSGVDVSGFSAADRVVGKAAAMLFAKARVASVYARVISAPALDYLTSRGIAVSYGVLTDRIINRKGDGLCPMEEAVMDISDFEEGYGVLEAKLDSMKG